MSFLRRLPLIACTLLALSGIAPSRAAEGAGPSAAELQMVGDSAPFRRVADDFVAQALAGNAARAEAMLSRLLVERMGAERSRQVLAERILPFFAAGGQVGRSVTISHTTDAAGASGFAFYMWLVPTGGGEPRPFTVYTVRERGQPVVANIVPDRLVEGRHR